MTALRSVVQLGEDHLAYGEYSCARLSARSAWAVSVGAAKDSPSLWAKGDAHFTNEDALLVAEQGERSLLAVADAHFGRQPSHTLIPELAAAIDPIPGHPDELTALLARMADREPVDGLRAGTSFVVAVFDHATGRGFGASYWDSTFAIVGPTGHRRPLAERQAGIVYLADPSTLQPGNADRFDFAAEPGELLLAYTDGVDSCHYDDPATSVTPAEMARLFTATGDDAEAYLRALVELALAGVGGHPGGEDNIAAVAVRA